MKLPIYLDNHATTRVDPRVVAEMVPMLSDDYGNAASRQHEYGWRAEAALELGRRRIASLIGALPEEIIFTSGATESVNLALKGVAEGHRSRGNHIVTASTEHRAVRDTCAWLVKCGFEVTTVEVDRWGLVDPADIQAAITPKTILVTIMAANNEIGTIAPIGEIGAICRERGVIFHTDATQAVGKTPIDVRAMHVGLMSFSAHKMYGPKGVGGLYVASVRPAMRLVPQMDGGGHEKGLRSGTVNVAGVVGFGKAAVIAQEEMAVESVRVGALRDRLVGGLTSELQGIRVNGHPSRRLYQNANITFPGVNADTLMTMIKDIAVSSGSACSSASEEPSYVLRALGLSRKDALGTIRFGLGRFTSAEEVEYTITRVAETVRLLEERRHLTQAH